MRYRFNTMQCNADLNITSCKKVEY